MKNIETLLTEHGITIPDEQKEAFSKAFNENYKTIAEFTKLSSKADSYKDQLEQANETIKGFEGIDPAKIKEEIEGYKKKAEDAEKDYTAKLAAKDYDEALSKAVDGLKFTSGAAKRSIMESIKSAKLPIKDGKLLGLNDLLETLKAEDADAFVSEEDERKPKFTQKATKNSSGMTKEQILAIKDASERQAAIAQNIDLFS